MSETGKSTPNWPEPVQTSSIYDVGRVAKLSGLPDRLRRVAWAEINKNAPQLAELLKEPALREAVQMFDAELFVDAEIVPSLPREWLKGRSG